VAGKVLRIMSYNIQVGISTRRPHQYLTNSWKHVFPHTQRMTNLDRVARLLGDCDLVGLQEVDAGSLRSNYVNLAEYLAMRAGFPYWYHQVNRNMGRFAKHSNGLLSRFHPEEVRDIPLPGLIPGRNAIMARFGTNKEPLAVFMLHLALSRRARVRQLSMISEMINEYPHAILMGDMNCRPGSPEMDLLFKHTQLREPAEETLTFPSWRPQHHIDHILVTPELKVRSVSTLNHAYSDHLPIVMELDIPDSVQFSSLAA